MKVLKFDGTSVGSAPCILRVKQIVDSTKEPVVVVVSALGGITDLLIQTAQVAAKGDEAYLNHFDQIATRHHDLVNEAFTDAHKKLLLHAEIDTLLAELRSLLQGVRLIKNLPHSALSTILSYGERLSVCIVTSLLKNTVAYDALDMIKTKKVDDTTHVLDANYTLRIVREMLHDDILSHRGRFVAVVAGFIATDSQSGEITTLGRGGSDYTASLIAAALEADTLELWTNSDGFMSADPALVPSATLIEKMTYNEAFEMCNFGSDIIYPPTLYPVLQKKIPIHIRNIFHPDHRGTVISHKAPAGRRLIKGITSISDISLVTVSGPMMVGVAGFSRRIFTTLADHGINVIFISQASSEVSVTIGVSTAHGRKAQQLLNMAFSNERIMGAMLPATLENDFAIVAVVGDKMQKRAGTAGKLFTLLGRNDINIKAFAQGASERNISFVVSGDQLQKTVEIIHDNMV